MVVDVIVSVAVSIMVTSFTVGAVYINLFVR